MRIFLCILFFLIPLVWSKYLNANYLSAKTFLLYFAASLALFGLPERLNIRRIPKACALLLVLIFCYYVGYYLVDPQYRYFPHLFKMLSFVFVALYIYSLRIKSSEIFKKTTYPFFLMWALILGFTGYEVFNLRVLEMNIKTDIILSTFGNINMFSEFAILSLPLLFLWTRHKDRIPQVLKLGFLGFLTFLIFYGRSRSAWMGLAMWVVFKAFQGLKKREWAALAAGLGLFLLSHFTANTDSISKFQPTAFSERASLYHASAEMLWDHPFGIGIGQFVNEIVPYLLNKPSGPNEYAYFDQPHSEFLKWGIQFGWPMLLLSLAFFALILFEILRRYRNSLATPMQERGLFLEF